MDPRAVIIVGGGLAGLVAARTLRQQGLEVTVLEAGELGGMIKPLEVGGVVIDAGAEAYATRTPAVRELCRDLGLEVAAPAGDPHVWWPDRGLHHLAAGIAGIPASWEDPAWAVLTNEELARAQHDRQPSLVPISEHSMLGDLVAHHLGAAAVDWLVSPVVRGIYGTTPEKMPIARIAPGLGEAIAREGSLVAAVAALRRDQAAVEQPVGGMFRLIEALGDELRASKVKILTSTPVTAVRRHAEHWELDTPSGRFSTQRWISATGRSALADLLAEIGVELPEPPVGQARNFFVALQHPGLDAEPVGSGVVIGAPGAELTARALTHYTAKWPWSAGSAHVLRVSWPLEAEAEEQAVLRNVEQLTGIQIMPEHVVEIREVVWPEMPRTMQPDDAQRVVQIEEELGVRFLGAWTAGNGLAAVVAQAVAL